MSDQIVLTKDSVSDDLSHAIRQVGTLVRVSTHIWHAKAKDTRASTEAAKAMNADATVVASYKYLLTSIKSEHEALKSAINRAYTAACRLTIPWADGWRLMANVEYETFFKSFGAANQQVQDAKGKFIAAYNRELANQMLKDQQALGDMYDPSLYKTADEINRAFGIQLEVKPVEQSGNNGFHNLPKAFIEKAAERHNQRIQQQLRDAMSDGWKRLASAVKNMAETLADEEKNRFHATLVTNVRDMVKVLGAFNVSNDPHYAELTQHIQSHLCRHTSAQLKNSTHARKDVAKKSADVLERMRQMGLA